MPPGSGPQHVMTAPAPEVVRAAQRILDGDDSMAAAAQLEGALHMYQPFDEDFDDLLEALALYAPRCGQPLHRPWATVRGDP
jgi:hypothetical protein